MSKKDASLAPVPPSAMMIRLSPLAGVVMAAFLLAGLLSCLWAIGIGGRIELWPEQASWRDIRNGEITHHIARELSKVPLAETAADLERAGSWLLLGDTGARVRQGCPGWLFLSDELRIHADAQRNAQARADKVEAVRAWLAQRNIRLLLVLVPDKSRIAAERGCGLARSPALETRLADWQAHLQRRGVEVLNLSEALQALGAEAFLRTDSHWSEAGAQAAAQAVARRVAALGVEPSPRQGWRREAGPVRARSGDLVRLAGLDWLPQRLQPPPDQVAESRFSAQGAQDDALSEDDLFGDSQLPNVALIGTSFSRNSNFMAFLEQDLGARLGNFAKDGGEFSGAARDYFASPAFLQTPPHLLIWEINERDLQSAYRDDIGLASAP